VSSLYCFLWSSCPKTTTYCGSIHCTFTLLKHHHRQTIDRPAESSKRSQLCSLLSSAFRTKRTTGPIAFVCTSLLVRQSQVMACRSKPPSIAAICRIKFSVCYSICYLAYVSHWGNVAYGQMQHTAKGNTNSLAPPRGTLFQLYLQTTNFNSPPFNEYIPVDDELVV
jgi:hypothetical protein